MNDTLNLSDRQSVSRVMVNVSINSSPQDPAKKKIGATAMSGTKDPSSDLKRAVPQTPIIVNSDCSYYSEMAD